MARAALRCGLCQSCGSLRHANCFILINYLTGVYTGFFFPPSIPHVSGSTWSEPSAVCHSLTLCFIIPDGSDGFSNVSFAHLQSRSVEGGTRCNLLWCTPGFTRLINLSVWTGFRLHSSCSVRLFCSVEPLPFGFSRDCFPQDFSATVFVLMVFSLSASCCHIKCSLMFELALWNNLAYENKIFWPISKAAEIHWLVDYFC